LERPQLRQPTGTRTNNSDSQSHDSILFIQYRGTLKPNAMNKPRASSRRIMDVISQSSDSVI
ncbi:MULTISPECIES: hypothetical protein, partial [unclassified Mycolicibacterium]|uniref:hypothetical protein n=1 Tax=unclassified Mycolicibacterium TaxID=2636767 RepID=UPI002ED7DC93